MQTAALILAAVILCSSGGLFYAAFGPLRRTSSRNTLILFAAIQLVLAVVLLWATQGRA